MTNSTYNQLNANLEMLKLTQMKLHLDEIRDFVTANGLSFTEGLLKLSKYEVDFKEQNVSRSMIKTVSLNSKRLMLVNSETLAPLSYNNEIILKPRMPSFVFLSNALRNNSNAEIVIFIILQSKFSI